MWGSIFQGDVIKYDRKYKWREKYGEMIRDGLRQHTLSSAPTKPNSCANQARNSSPTNLLHPTNQTFMQTISEQQPNQATPCQLTRNRLNSTSLIRLQSQPDKGSRKKLNHPHSGSRSGGCRSPLSIDKGCSLHHRKGKKHFLHRKGNMTFPTKYREVVLPSHRETPADPFWFQQRPLPIAPQHRQEKPPSTIEIRNENESFPRRP